MKKLLKALGVAAVAAAVVPCKIEKDELTGIKTYQTLLSRLRVGPGAGGEGTNISLDALGGVLPTVLGHSEADDYADDELEDMTTESIFEMKVERHIPNEPKAEACEAPETCEDSASCDAPEACEACEACEAPGPADAGPEPELDL